jgi:hypothetical protein
MLRTITQNLWLQENALGDATMQHCRLHVQSSKLLQQHADEQKRVSKCAYCKLDHLVHAKG